MYLSENIAVIVSTFINTDHIQPLLRGKMFCINPASVLANLHKIYIYIFGCFGYTAVIGVIQSRFSCNSISQSHSNKMINTFIYLLIILLSKSI